MTTPWEEFGYGPWKATQVVPDVVPSEAQRASRLPPTLRPVSGAIQRPVYDPSARHYQNGMRLSEPQFADSFTAGAWIAARRDAIDQVLAAVADSPWAEHLLLRGSVLLSAWFGAAAREPGDVDFIVIPQDWTVRGERTDEMFADLAHRAAATANTGDSTVRISADEAISDDIWTYDRVPGRRLVLPWTSARPGIPGGTVQIDFVFNETLRQPPEWTDVARLTGPGQPARLLTASPELSLAWKILWLATSTHPEGKDLYDAVLLAEHCDLSHELLMDVLNPGAAWQSTVYGRVPHWAVGADWFEFGKDYPDLANDHDAYVWRLIVALAPAFPPGLTALYDLLADEEVRSVRSFHTENPADPLAAVEKSLARVHHTTLHLLVLVREVLGRAQCSLTQAADIIADMRHRNVPTALPGRVDPHEIAARLAG